MSWPDEAQVSALLLPLAQQPSMPLGATTRRLVASVEQTDGQYSLYRLELGPQAGGARPHWHRTFTETFYVVSGVVQLFDGAAWVDAGQGDHLHIPPYGVHGFRNERPEPAVLLMSSVPGVRREDYFAELAEVVRSGRELSTQEWAELYARHDQYML